MAKKAKDTSGLKLVTEEAQDARKRFEELYDKANKQTPAAGVSAERLAALMRDNPGEKLWRRIQGPMAVAESFALEHFQGATPGVRECWRERLAEMRKALAGENPSEVESLLSQHAALCWLHLAEVEIHYTAKLSASHTLTLGAYYNKRLTMAQRRFTRAVETLERVRMMRRRAGADRGAAEAERRRA